ncbi:hypothetical protein BWQ96_02160 [Gracilariopsis chorda]|uniref:Uncharacterized protein n=1 Tax=Gracilariopsis chorda TaxID=448386 RepID=A0A2V3J1E9_9FLOR|nr:hypothetical protein BWQ96_02160 [Gracilariopsis chorda]|eukprot:PXF48208.1 hypothetical protein BWQ96_02160 [Gracilariopsis chorda]
MDVTTDEVGGLPYGTTAESLTTMIMAILGIREHIRKRRSQKRTHGGSLPGRAPNRNIGREQAADYIHQAYFLNATELNPITGDELVEVLVC